MGLWSETTCRKKFEEDAATATLNVLDEGASLRCSTALATSRSAGRGLIEDHVGIDRAVGRKVAAAPPSSACQLARVLVPFLT
jgi:hypothetical protein